MTDRWLPKKQTSFIPCLLRNNYIFIYACINIHEIHRIKLFFGDYQELIYILLESFQPQFTHPTSFPKFLEVKQSRH